MFVAQEHQSYLGSSPLWGNILTSWVFLSHSLFTEDIPPLYSRGVEVLQVCPTKRSMPTKKIDINNHYKYTCVVPALGPCGACPVHRLHPRLSHPKHLAYPVLSQVSHARLPHPLSCLRARPRKIIVCGMGYGNSAPTMPSQPE